MGRRCSGTLLVELLGNLMGIAWKENRQPNALRSSKNLPMHVARQIDKAMPSCV